MSKTGEWGDKIIITLRKKTNDKRRHKSRCENYRKTDGYCCLTQNKCGSSIYCEYYKERCEIQADAIPPAPPRKPKINNTSKSMKQEDFLRQVGAKLRHRTYGEVTVVSSTAENITVKTQSGEEHALKLNECIKNNILKLIK